MAFASLMPSDRPSARYPRLNRGHAAGLGGFSRMTAEAPYRERAGGGDVGQRLAAQGRGGDSLVAHINPIEAGVLARRRGAQPGINPGTGLPEFQNPLDMAMSYFDTHDPRRAQAAAALADYNSEPEQPNNDWQGTVGPGTIDTHAARPQQQRESTSSSGSGRDPGNARASSHPLFDQFMSGVEANRAAGGKDLIDVGGGVMFDLNTGQRVGGDWGQEDTDAYWRSQGQEQFAGAENTRRGIENSQEASKRVFDAGGMPDDWAGAEKFRKMPTPPPTGGFNTIGNLPIGTKDNPGALPAKPAHAATTTPAISHPNMKPATGTRALTEQDFAAIEQARLNGTWMQTDIVQKMTPADEWDFYRMYGYIPGVRLDGGIYRSENTPAGLSSAGGNAIIGSPAVPQSMNLLQQLAFLSPGQLQGLARSMGVPINAGAALNDGVGGRTIHVTAYSGHLNSGPGRPSGGWMGTIPYEHNPQPGMSMEVGRTGGIAEIPIAMLESNPGLRQQVKALLDAGETNMPPGVVFYSTHPAELAARNVPGFEQFKQPANGMFDPSMVVFDDRPPSDYWTNPLSPGYFRSPEPGIANAQSTIDSTPEMFRSGEMVLFRHKDGTVVDHEGWVQSPIQLGNGQMGYLDTKYAPAGYDIIRNAAGMIVDRAGNPITTAMSGGRPTGHPSGLYGTIVGVPDGGLPKNGEGGPTPYLDGRSLPRSPIAAPPANNPPGGGNSTVPGGNNGGGGQTPAPGTGGGQSPPPSTTPAPTGSGAPISVPTILTPSQRRRFASGFGTLGL